MLLGHDGLGDAPLGGLGPRFRPPTPPVPPPGPRYLPPTRVVTTEIPYLALVNQADPEFERRKHREVEYAFDGRAFLADPYNRGAYDRRSNVYPVGQPYGVLDPLVEAALEPTVGNPIPGLYEGVPDGKGWA